jgi:hypothetical protein
MTWQIKLMNSAETAALTVDLTNKNVDITRDGTNPLILIPLPADSSSSSTAGGAEAFDLKMMSDTINIAFDLKDGLGYHRNTAGTVVTDYEKIYYLFKYDLEKKHFYWGESTQATTKFHVVITRVSITYQAGKKDFMPRCQMSLTVVNED